MRRGPSPNPTDERGDDIRLWGRPRVLPGVWHFWQPLIGLNYSFRGGVGWVPSDSLILHTRNLWNQRKPAVCFNILKEKWHICVFVSTLNVIIEIFHLNINFCRKTKTSDWKSGSNHSSEIFLSSCQKKLDWIFFPFFLRRTNRNQNVSVCNCGHRAQNEHKSRVLFGRIPLIIRSSLSSF